MAWTKAGFWKAEDGNDSVISEVAKVVDAGGPLMKQAQGLGQQVANSRGLGNSSLAAQASQAAVLDKAVDIGKQQASQTASYNNTQLQGNNALRVQKSANQAAMERTTATLSSQEKIAAENRAAEMALLDRKIAADLELARQGDQAAMDRLRANIASQEAIAQADREATMDRLMISEEGAFARQTAGDEAALARTEATIQGGLDQQAMADAAAYERALAQIQSNENLSEMDRQAALDRLNMTIEADAARQQQADDAALARQEMGDAAAMDRQQLDATTRLNLGQMEIDQRQTETMVNSYTQIQSNYMNAISNLSSNADLPANTRKGLQSAIEKSANSSIQMVRDAYGMDFDWQPPGGGSIQTQTPAPTPSTTRLNLAGLGI